MMSEAARSAIGRPARWRQHAHAERRAAARADFMAIGRLRSGQLPQGAPRARNERPLVEHPFEHRQLVVPVDFGEQRLGGETRIERAGDQEAAVAIPVDLVAGRPGNDRREVARAQAYPPGVAEGAIDADARDAARDHSRQCRSACRGPRGCRGRAPCSRPDRAGTGEHARQHEPDPIRNAVRFRADRAVEKVLLIGGELRRRLLAGQPPGGVDQDADDEQRQKRQSDQEASEDVCRSRHRSRSLEHLEILDEGRLLGIGERCAIEMSAVAVAGQGRVELRELMSALAPARSR